MLSTVEVPLLQAHLRRSFPEAKIDIEVQGDRQGVSGFLISVVYNSVLKEEQTYYIEPINNLYQLLKNAGYLIKVIKTTPLSVVSSTQVPAREQAMFWKDGKPRKGFRNGMKYHVTLRRYHGH